MIVTEFGVLLLGAKNEKLVKIYAGKKKTKFS